MTENIWIYNLVVATTIIAIACQTKLHTAKQPLGIGKTSAEGGAIELARKMPTGSASASGERLEGQQQSIHGWCLTFN